MCFAHRMENNPSNRIKGNNLDGKNIINSNTNIQCREVSR